MRRMLCGGRWGAVYGDAAVARLGMGRLLHEVDATLDAASRGEGARLVLISGHDSTIVPFLAALGLFDNQWPPYAAHVRVELGSTPSGHVARVLYQGLPLAVGETAADPAGWVPLASLRSLLQRSATTEAEYRAECAATETAAPAAGANDGLEDTLTGGDAP